MSRPPKQQEGAEAMAWKHYDRDSSRGESREVEFESSENFYSRMPKP